MNFSIKGFDTCFISSIIKINNKRIRIAKVVVRIPPPTELGEDPININMLIIIFVASLKCDTSIVCKPALRVVAD